MCVRFLAFCFATCGAEIKTEKTEGGLSRGARAKKGERVDPMYIGIGRVNLIHFGLTRYQRITLYMDKHTHTHTHIYLYIQTYICIYTYINI